MTVALATTLQSWVAANVPPTEKILCQRELRGEYFFVARAGDEDQLRLGSRVDLTGYKLETFSISLRWQLRDQNDQSIVPKIPVQRVRDELLQGGGKVFAESVQIQTINVGSPAKRLRARALVVKCPEHPCPKDSPRAKRYAVRVCDTAL